MKFEKNLKLRMIVGKIVRIITDSMGGDVTILLLGSYARGKGRFDENGHPVGDIDLAIITNEIANIKAAVIKQKLQSCDSLANVIIDLHFYSFDALVNVLPFWKFYDLKHNSELLSGRDIRTMICNFNSSEISKYDGLRMLAGELAKAIQRKVVDENKLNFVLKSAEDIKDGCYGKKTNYGLDKVSINEYVNYALEYYKEGFKGSAKWHLQPTINYVIKKKISIDVKNSFILSFVVQVIWTLLWALKTRNLKVLTDWRDPALRIYYCLIYSFTNQIEEHQKRKLFRKTSYPHMEYSKENLLRLYESYFRGDRWKSIKKSSQTSSCKFVIK